MSVTDPQHFDETALARLRDLGGEKLVGRMIDLFLEHAPERVAMARASGQAGDLETVRRAVHSIQSTAGNLGAVMLQELASRIERFADEKQGDLVSQLLRDLEEAFSRAMVHLKETRKGLER